MKPEQLHQYLFERYESERLANDQMRESMRAMASATKRMADTLTEEQKRRQVAETALSRIEQSLTKAHARVEDLHLVRSPSAMSAEELANAVDFNKLCEARRIVWNRTHPNAGWDPKDPAKPPRPLPPLPDDLPRVRPRNDEPTGKYVAVKPKTLLEKMAGGVTPFRVLVVIAWLVLLVLVLLKLH